MCCHLPTSLMLYSRVARCRYVREVPDGALWVSSDNMPGVGAIPACQNCGSARCLEFQILPQVCLQMHMHMLPRHAVWFVSGDLRYFCRLVSYPPCFSFIFHEGYLAPRRLCTISRSSWTGGFCQFTRALGPAM
jgi:hypothetical protein